MRVFYLSDLHLESQDFPWKLPKGDVLIIAGDLCHARVLDPSRTDKYGVNQRNRVMRFLDKARASFTHIVLVAGNHEHYDGVLEDTHTLLRKHLEGIHVLDDDSIAIGGVHMFGSTLWSDFEGRSETAMNGVRKRLGEYFFVKTRRTDDQGREMLSKFQPEDALRAHDAAWAALLRFAGQNTTGHKIIVTHHAPSRCGLNTAHVGNGLDGAFASDLDDRIAQFEGVPIWIHGHTHVRHRYRIGATTVLVNCRGFDGRETSARSFSPDTSFDL